MSTALIILLNNKIPDDIMEQYNNFEITSYLDNNNLIVNNETTMHISDASEILKKNSISGYDLGGYAYALEDGSGALLYKDFKNTSLPLTDVQVDYKKGTKSMGF